MNYWSTNNDNLYGNFMNQNHIEYLKILLTKTFPRKKYEYLYNY